MGKQYLIKNIHINHKVSLHYSTHSTPKKGETKEETDGSIKIFKEIVENFQNIRKDFKIQISHTQRKPNKYDEKEADQGIALLNYQISRWKKI